MSRLERPSVQRVIAALRSGGSAAEVIELSSTARTAEDAARSLAVEVGAIVKSLVFVVGTQPVLALVAGDRRCHAEALPRALGLEGEAGRADADTVRAATGFAIGGVAPVGTTGRLPVAIDASLGRFPAIYAAAGHPHCVFGTTLDELARLTGGTISTAIAA